MIKKKPKVGRLLIPLLYLLIVFIGLELGLRVLGYGPPTKRPQDISFYIENDRLGWTLAPGAYRFPINTWGDTMNLTINSNGERITRFKPVPENSDEILFIGGSFIMGAGLDDEETLTWKLQEEFPSVNVRNLGVGGYGTYQSLLVLEDQFANLKKPQAVIYGFMSHHRQRNVGDADWLGALAINANRSSTEQIHIPYVRSDENEKLIEGELIQYYRLPLHEKLASSFMTQRMINNLLGAHRSATADKILELVLLRMRQLCSQHDVPFYVSLLHLPEAPMEETTKLLNENDIAHIDCNVPLNQDNTFKDDGHPKEEVIDEWKKRIGQRLLRDGVVSKD